MRTISLQSIYKFLTLITLLFLSGCNEYKKSTLTIGSNVWPGYEPLYLAAKTDPDKTNFYKMVEFPSSSEVLRAFQNGSLDIAATTLDEAILLQSQGIDVKIILVLDISMGADVLLARPEIPSKTNLKGKKIGVEYTALGAYMLARYLELNHLAVTDITLVPVDVDQHELYFNQKKIDAIITFEPIRSRLYKKGARLVFSSAEIPGEIVDVLISRGEIWRNNKRKIRKITELWYETLDQINTDFEKLAPVMNERLNLTTDELRTAFQEIALADRSKNEKLLTGGHPQLVNTIQKVHLIMKVNKLLSETHKVDPNSMIDIYR